MKTVITIQPLPNPLSSDPCRPIVEEHEGKLSEDEVFAIMSPGYDSKDHDHTSRKNIAHRYSFVYKE